MWSTSNASVGYSASWVYKRWCQGHTHRNRTRNIRFIRTCCVVCAPRADHIWSTDITYVRLLNGFVYLVAIIDWYSRDVLSWELSISLETSFCTSALDWALHQSQPEIFNSDQGAQFTSQEFTGRLLERGIRISMDGRGRALDNIFVERLWRSVKYEMV